MKEKGQKKQNKNKDRKKQRSGASYSENVRAKWSCCVFKLSFVRLKCKASLIIKSNLELALSIILKERELYESKHVILFRRSFFLVYLLTVFPSKYLLC